MTSLSNGTLRKSLASQLDRLDTILDGLSNGLKDAMAGAVQEAVRGIVTELMSRPEVLARLNGGATITARANTETAKQPSSMRKCVSRMCRWIGTQARNAYDGARNMLSRGLDVCRSAPEQACGLVALAWLRTGVLRPFNGPLLRALAAGAVIGVAMYFAEPWLAAGVSAVGGFGTALAVQGGLWLRQMLGDVETAS